MTDRIIAETLRDLGWQEDAEGVWTHPMVPGKYNESTAVEVVRRALAGYTGNKAEDWEPSPEDIAWQERQMRKLAPGGVWQTSFAAFKIYRHDKEVTVIYGDRDSESVRRVIKTFEAMGWTVKEKL